MTNWENFSSSVTFHGCQQVDGIRGFRVGYLAGRIEQLAVDRLNYTPADDEWETMGEQLNQYQRKLSALEKQWNVHVDFEVFEDSWLPQKS